MLVEVAERMKIGIFEDPLGDVSSKRVSSFYCLIVATVLAFCGYPDAVVIAFLSGALAFQGVSALSEIGLKKE